MLLLICKRCKECQQFELTCSFLQFFYFNYSSLLFCVLLLWVFNVDVSEGRADQSSFTLYTCIHPFNRVRVYFFSKFRKLCSTFVFYIYLVEIKSCPLTESFIWLSGVGGTKWMRFSCSVRSYHKQQCWRYNAWGSMCPWYPPLHCLTIKSKRYLYSTFHTQR